MPAGRRPELRAVLRLRAATCLTAAGELLEARVAFECRERGIDAKPARREKVWSSEQLLEQVERFRTLTGQQVDAGEQMELIRPVHRVPFDRQERDPTLALRDRLRVAT